MRIILLFLILVTISGSLSDDLQYCNLKSCGTARHILCPSTPKFTCDKNVTSHGFSQDEKDRIVKFHNKLRSKVVKGKEPKLPPAAKMEKMVWDDELARMAQAWTDQCQIGHNECSDNLAGWVGQNFVLSPSKVPKGTVEVESQILEWYKEIDDFDPNNLNRPFDLADLSGPKQIGHFTQLLWSTTNKVGCGRIKYTVEYEYNMYFMVCNYSPGGNYHGQYVYPLVKSSTQESQPKQEPIQKQSQPKQEPIQKQSQPKQEPIQKQSQPKQEPIQKQSQPKQEPMQKQSQPKQKKQEVQYESYAPQAGQETQKKQELKYQQPLYAQQTEQERQEQEYREQLERQRQQEEYDYQLKLYEQQLLEEKRKEREYQEKLRIYEEQQKKQREEEEEQRQKEIAQRQQEYEQQIRKQQVEQERRDQEYREQLRRSEEQQKKQREEEDRQQEYEYQQYLKTYYAEKAKYEQEQEAQRLMEEKQRQQMILQSYGAQSQQSYIPVNNPQAQSDWDKTAAAWLNYPNQQYADGSVYQTNQQYIGK